MKSETEGRVNNAQLLVDDFVLLLARLDGVLGGQLDHWFELGVRVGVLDLAAILTAIVLLLLCAHCCLAWGELHRVWRRLCATARGAQPSAVNLERSKK
jgi:hypothetical protein